MRFPGFTDKWKRIKVSELLDFYSTNSLSWDMLNYDGGEIKNLHYGLIHSGLPTLVDVSKDSFPFVNEASTPKKYTLCKEGDVAFADASEDTNEVGKVVEFLNTNGENIISGLHTIHGRDKSDMTVTGFKGYAFSSLRFHHQIRRIAQGTKIYSISTKTFDEVYIGVPTKDEQAKIARLLQLLDERIATQNKIIEDLKKLKSAIMAITFGNSIVTKNQWREVRLGNICERVTRRNSNNISNLILTIAAQYGLVSQIDFFNKSVASADLSNYYLLDKGDFAYNKSYSGEYTWGAVKRLDLYPQGVLSPLYICFRPMEGIIDSDFLVYLFESKCWYREVSEICVEGARNHGLLNVSVVDFFNMKLHLPDLSEQKRIAEMMNAISDKIEHSSRLYALYNNQKKFLLSNMFI